MRLLRFARNDGFIKLVFFTLHFSLFTFHSFAQSLNIILKDSTEQKQFNSLKKELKSKTEIRDSLTAIRESQNVLLKLQTNGFLAASVDSLYKDSTGYTALVFLGNKFEWATLSKGNAEQFLSGTGYRQRLYSGKTFNSDQVSKLLNNILVNCENNGYPFASVSLDSVAIDGDQIHAAINLNRNRLVKIDSIIIYGPRVVTPVYLYNYIGMKPGDIYNESLIRKISNRLRELPFLTEARQYEITFDETQSKLHLYPESRKASQFDGVLGVLPDNENKGKVNLTGELHLKLQNSLKRGEVIELNWKQLPLKTQDLKVHGLYPFLLNTPVGLDGALAIYKKDTTYLDVIKSIGVQYQFTGNNFIKAFLTNKESSLLSTADFESLQQLPEFADISTTSYGLTLHLEKLDYRFNPRKGFAVELTGSTGKRIITKNPKLDDERRLYDTLRLRTTQYHIQFNGDYFLPLGQRSVIDIGNITGWIQSPELFTNELFRIGGLRSLRGFDEESIYASSFSIGKIEYRYLIEQNSFLFAFVNGAYYDNRSRNKYIHDTPYGFGAGINFETKLGIMSVSYALGKEFENPVYFRNGKVHFGIVNYF